MRIISWVKAKLGFARIDDKELLQIRIRTLTNDIIEVKYNQRNIIKKMEQLVSKVNEISYKISELKG